MQLFLCVKLGYIEHVYPIQGSVMKPLYVALFSIILMFTYSSKSFASDEKKVIQAQLEQFLSENNSRAIHQAFWAEELVYTSSSGKRFGKHDIMQSFEDESPNSSNKIKMDYSAKNVDIQLYQQTAVLTFTLVAKSPDKVLNFLNTGTFIKREGQWQAVAWQATKVPIDS